MNLKEDIKQLESLKEDRKSFLENDAEHDEMFLKDIEAINTVLQALEDKDLDEANIRADAMLDMDKIWRNKIKEKIEELKVKLEDVSNHREKSKEQEEQEEQAVLWCLEIRLDERIKAYEELLKGE